MPDVCFVSGGNTGAPAPKSRTVGSPVSHTHPFGQGLPPTVQTLLQKPEPVDPAAQKHAPVVSSLVVPAVVQAAPGCLVRATVFIVQSPKSFWQTNPVPSGEQSASFWLAL
jgi:hypothetical protein